MGEYVAAIDQGTTSTRCLIFDRSGRRVGASREEHRQIHPRPGWVEHDAEEIWRNTQQVVRGALSVTQLTVADLAAVGISNQRETTVLWERDTGEPVANAVVWQDTRTDRLCAELAAGDWSDRFRETTGLPVATYFSGPKVRWLLDRTEGLRERAEEGEILFGTIDSWLIWKLTGEHLTDVTNASRTLLMGLETLEWDPSLLDKVGIPSAMLPEIRPSSEVLGEGSGVLEGVPIGGVLGDQQAALVGQACLEEGEAKNTYGTGCFLLMHTGFQPILSRHGLIGTVAYRFGDHSPAYALEGSIAVAGALVQWLRDNLGLISSSDEVEGLAASVDDTGGVHFVPAFSGLFAPHWRSDARGVIAGLTHATAAGHLARAALEATAWQTREVADAMAEDSGLRLEELRVDGGMVSNELFLQIQADVLGIPIVRSAVTETTALGAAYAAGLAVELWESQEELRSHWREDRRWEPQLPVEEREARYGQWQKAVARTLHWID